MHGINHVLGVICEAGAGNGIGIVSRGAALNAASGVSRACVSYEVGVRLCNVFNCYRKTALKI